MSLNIDRGRLIVRDGLTHYPQERRTFEYFKGAVDRPARIIILDGSGSLSFDVINWLSEQSIPLFRVDWQGDIVSVIGGSSFAQNADRVRWQVETRHDPERRLEFCSRLIAEKLQNSLQTMVTCVPDSRSRQVAIARAEGAISKLRGGHARDVDDVRTTEAWSAAAYFQSWAGTPINWKSKWKHPIPDHWLQVGSRRSSKGGRFATNRNATHPINAMLNYAYAVARSEIHIQTVADGYDPCRGVMHHDRDDTQAFVYDLIEPRRPLVDAAVLSFIQTREFTGADFALRENGICRIAPQLARTVANIAATSRSLIFCGRGGLTSAVDVKVSAGGGLLSG
ncbi:CRISPR-associated endonuclease Cas1 [Phenylobacterium sp.]|uniref:CRISPR-associated endonuclease Cas1 n=1 Tax=Phenylobacterium sp. TaxID=1871053 RepID=UPI00301BDB56